MKKFNQPIDEFFRDALSNHTVNPSEKAEAAFLKEASGWVPDNKSRNRKILFLLGGMLIIFAGLGIYLTTDSPVSTGAQKNQTVNSAETRSNLKTAEPQATTTHNSEAKPVHVTSVQQAVPYSDNIQQPIPNTSEKKNQGTSSTSETNQTDVIKTIIAAPNEKEVNAETPTAVPVAPVTETTKLLTESQTEYTSNESGLNSASVQQIPDTLIIPGKHNSSEKQKRSQKLNRSWDISSGVYYTPEWMFNLLEGEKFVNSFGLEGTFRFGKYSVRTGAGLSITKGSNELAISYNDYLGNYQQLDSMSFSWNEQRTKLLPTYYLSEKNVYDSLMKLDNAKIVKRYTYLQVPLILGYDIVKNEKFSFGFRAGPILSILLESKKISGDYEPGMNQIISINQISPDRIQTNWQVMAGVNAAFNFSRKFGIELEPQVRYYFNSVYEQSDNTDKPWSVGIRAALYLNY